MALRTSIVSLGAASLLLLAGCGNGGDTSSDTAPAATQPTATETVTPAAETAPTATETPAAAAVEAVDTSTLFAALPAPYSDADYNRGRRTFKLCQACHTLTEGGPSIVGPNLYGLFGRQIGGVDGFAYSKVVQAETFVWTPEKLDEWLANPRGFLPGNNMSFAGVRKPEDRVAVIAYIMSETGYAAE